MSRRSLPILLVLLAVLFFGVVWLVNSLQVAPAPDTARVDVPASVERAETAEPASSASSTSADAPAPSPTPASLAEAEPTGTAARQAVEDGETPEDAIDMSETWTVEGRVELPPGTPGDERVQVLASVAGPRNRMNDARVHSRSELGSDGSFKVSFSKAAEKGRLVLEARYLYLAITHEISPDDLGKLAKPIVLRPELGGCIRGRLLPPRNAVDVERLLVGTEVDLGGSSPSDQRDWSNRLNRNAKVGEDLTFEFGGLPSTRIYDFYLRSEEVVDAHQRNLEIQPGRVLTIDVPIELGAKVSGKVVDEKGAPVEGVELFVRVENSGSSYSSGQQNRTPADGTFSLRGIAPGDVSLRLSKDGFTPLETEIGRLVDGDVRTGVEAVLRRGASVAGRVQWPDGRPAAKARIEYRFSRQEGNPKFRYFQSESAEVTADEQGVFEITGLGELPITLTAQGTPPTPASGPTEETPAEEPKAAAMPAAAKAKLAALGYVADPKGPKESPWKAHLESVASGTRDLVLTLSKGAAVRGRAVDDLGAAIERFHVRAEPVDGSQEWERTQSAVRASGKDGAFEIVGLHEGEWDVYAESKSHADSSARRVRFPGPEEELSLVLPRAGKVSGIVVDTAGQPVKGARAISRPADLASRYTWNNDDGPSARTDDDGRFELEAIKPGPVRITASADGFATSAPHPIELAPGQAVADLTLALRKPGRITGEVVDDAGRPLAGRPVHVNGMEGGFNSRDTETDAAGRFEFGGVSPDRYWVNSQASEKELAALDLDEEERQAQWAMHQKSATVTVEEGETVHVVLGGTPKDGIKVHGKVYAGAARDRTVPRCTLWIHKKPYDSGSPITGVSDAEGNYAVVVPAAGEYAVSAMNPKSGTTTTTKLTVPEEKKDLEQDIVLPGGRIAGRVIGIDGKPIAGIQVSCAPEQMTAMLSGDASYGNGMSDEAGKYSFDGLGPGTYRMEAGVQEWQNMPGVEGKCVRSGVVLTADGRIDDLDMRLQPECRVEGVVTGPDGQPLSGASVYARDENGSVIQRWPPTSTDASGRFTMTGLVPGKVTFAARTKTFASAETAAVRVSPDETTKVQIEMLKGTRLRVIVRGGEGQPVGSFVTMADASGRDLTMMYADYGFGGGQAGEGQVMGPVPPGRYRLTATNHDRKSESQDVSVAGEEEVVVTIELGG